MLSPEERRYLPTSDYANHPVMSPRKIANARRRTANLLSTLKRTTLGPRHINETYRPIVRLAIGSMTKSRA